MSIKQLIEEAMAELNAVAAGMVEGRELGRVNAARYKLEEAHDLAKKLPVKRAAKAPAKPRAVKAK